MLRISRRLDGAHGCTLATRGALAHTGAVGLKPVLRRQQDVGHAGGRRLPQILAHEEVQVGECLPLLQAVRHAHEVARGAPTGLDRVRVARLDGLPHARVVRPALPPTKQRVILDAERLVELLGGDVRDARGHSAQTCLEHEVALRTTTVTCGNVPVTGQADVGVHGTAHGDGVAAVLDGQLILDAAVAVTGGRVNALGVDQARLLDGLGRHTGDFGNLLGRVLAHAVGEQLPHGRDLRLLAVLELHLELAVQRGVNLGIERRGVGHPTLRHAGHQVLLHALVAGRGLFPRFAFPKSRACVEVRHAVIQVVPHHELVRVAVFLQVAFLQQARLHLELAAGEAVGLVAGGLDVVAHEERAVRPLLGEQVVVQLVVDEDVQPAHGHGAVGAGAQVQPDVGFLAQVRHAGVNHDVRVGLLGNVDDGTARVVVVRQLRAGAPRRVHLRAADGLHPGSLHHGVHGGGEEARALAHLPRDAHVRAADQLAKRAVREHAPNARRAGHAEDCLAAVAVHGLLQLLGDGAHGLVPRDALPTGIVLAARVRALHRVV